MPCVSITNTNSDPKMKKTIICLAAGLIALVSCSKEGIDNNPFTISSPTPTVALTKVALTETEQGYVKAGNGMAFRFMESMYEGKNMVLSPLSLQYALAMTANGASGETLREIIDFLGYGKEGIDALNAYSKKMLEQLPAVDLDVALKLTDAILVNNLFPLYPEFKKTVEENYYAVVDNMDFIDAATIATRINQWASKSTDGFIDKVLSPEDISQDAAAFLMNALYFKAQWAGNKYNPMFEEYATQKDDFFRSDKSKLRVDYMRNSKWHKYADMEGYKVLALPYAGGNFNMYILLPDENDLDALMDKLPGISWSSILSSFKNDALVHVKLPKFDIENKYNLSDNLRDLGVERAFNKELSSFDRMFKASEAGWRFWIESVIQKAKISVAEWGTEAAAVTVVQMDAESAMPGDPEKPREVYFYADHPFVFLIGEVTSGAILFEGVFTGKE